MPQTLNVAGIAGDSIVDGPGIRTTVFVEGCPHGCPGCQNPETWAFGAGREMTADEVYAQIRKNPLCRGVTCLPRQADASGFSAFLRGYAPLVVFPAAADTFDFLPAAGL